MTRDPFEAGTTYRSAEPDPVGHDGPRSNAVSGEGSDVQTDVDPPWSIAEVAEEFGVTHRTVRHYEALGLIVPQRDGLRRIYRRRDRTRLNLILRGKRLGFPLDEIRRIVDMYDQHPGEAGQLRYLLSQIKDRRTDLERRRRDVEDSLQELDHLEHRCTEDLAHLMSSEPPPPDR